MMRKLSWFAKVKELAWGSFGIAFGYGFASKTFHTRSEYAVAREQRTIDAIEQTKSLLKKYV